ncbi:MAG TPA: hypothetical protein EYG94_00085 [Campylobacterales bacterium]|nr:hypothetical protein [Campylobacterales bacterium]
MNEAKGLKELTKALKQFPKNIQKNVMLGAVRAGTKPIIKRAKELVPVEEGDLKKSIRAKKRRVPKSTPYVIKFSVHAGGNMKKAGQKLRPFYGSFIEFGYMKPTKEGFKHMTARPFMRPAMEQEASNSIVFVRDYIQKRIPKEIEKAKKRKR